MKKLLIVAACLGMQSAYATKARMSALGQDAGRGSFYLEDNRNIWRSASHVNDLDRMLTVEHGTNYLEADGETPQSATAEGGVFFNTLGHQIGLYFNNDQYGNAHGAGGVIEPARVELFFGRASLMNLGVRLGYEKINYDLNGHESYGFDFGFGLEVSGVDLWLNYAPEITTTTGGATTFDDPADMNIGAGYDYGDYKLFFEYASSEDYNTDTNSTVESTAITAGVARVYQKDQYTAFYDLRVESTEEGTTEGLHIPLTFGVETIATDWLTWRLSVRQSLYGKDEVGGRESSARTTSVGAGAALTFKELSIEGSLQGLVNTDAGDTRLGMNDLLSNVSVKYNF